MNVKCALPALTTLFGVAILCLTATLPPALGQEGTTTKSRIDIPAAEKDRKNPVPATADSIENGKLLFSSQCTMCHGSTGDGSGVLVERLNLQVPDFTNAEGMRERSDGELFYILTNGHGRMPGQGDRFKDEIKWNLINFVRTLPAGAGS